MADSEKQFLVIDKDGNGHLPVRKSADGPLDHGLMGAAHAALLSPQGFQGNPYAGPDKEKAIAKLRRFYEEEKMPWPTGQAMSELAGRWVDVWKPGEYSGERYTVHDLNHIVQHYNPAEDEAPVTQDHDSKGPAFAWVRALRDDAGTLQAMFDQVDPGFEAEVKAGRYKKISVELITKPTGPILAAVSFLGAKRPAVKGLRPAFAEPPDPASLIVFERDFGFPGTDNQEEGHMDKEELKQTFGEAVEGLLKKLGFGKKEEPPAVKTFSEVELKAATDKAAADAKGEAERIFAEKQKAGETAVLRKNKTRELIERLKPLGKWIPAFEKLGLIEFMEALPAEQTIEFGEAGKKEKKSAVEIFQKFLEGLPKIVEFGELAGDRKPANTPAELRVTGGIRVDPHSVRLAERVDALRKADKKLTFEEASAQARQELGDVAAAV